MSHRLVETLASFARGARTRAGLATVAIAGAMLVGCPGPSVTPRPDTGVLPDTGVPMDTGTGTDTGTAGNCGNGTVDTAEECDGTDLDGETCVTQGHTGGTLACDSSCHLDETGCDANPCGNGAIDTGEDCDGTMLGGGTCVSEGFLSGTLGCSATCTYDTTACDACGDGNVDAGELCDGTDLDGESCATRGFTGGTLACSAACTFDTGACVDTNCGNAAVDPGEDCDGAMLGASSCVASGFASGTVTCNADCTVNTSACTLCGNGSVDGVEACDGTAFGTHTCVTEGFTMGTLACAADCTLVTSGCSTAMCGNGTVEAGEGCDDANVATGDGCAACVVETGFVCMGAPSACHANCGDGMIVGGEACDGANLGGATCTSVGFAGGGTLACSATCTLNTAGCFAGLCGNTVINPGEECDDGNNTALDGCDPSCHVEPTFDLPVRLVGIGGVLTDSRGRLEVRFGGAWRDVCDDFAGAQVANVVCRQLGYTGTGHTVFTAGGGSETPVMDDLMCTGTEPNLSQCPFAGWNSENCVSAEALGVQCVPAEGDIRVIGGANTMNGRVQVFHAGAWGEVCDDIVDSDRYGVTTICQQIGYRRGTNSDLYSAPGDVFSLDNVACVGTERRITACPHNAFGSEDCTAFEAQGVVCTEYTEGDTRVVGGSGRNSGRIEVLHNNIWVTVCDDYIDPAVGASGTNFGGVACRQLGFTGGAPLASGSVPDGVDPIGLDDVMCGGTETALLMCPATPFGMHNCGHYEDVGVTCTP
jgi:cysteine-rich repeat protein